MVDVQERFCIDRFEASLVDARLSRPLSPFFFPSRERTRSAYDGWQSLRTSLGAPEFRILPIPEPPEFQFREEFEPLARSVRGVTPNGYLSGNAAESACRRAGKRLCNEKEWVFACRGERDTNFPYGESYSAGKCNVKNAKHPARLLHGDASKGHLDPRLNHFQHEGSPLLHETGSHLECASRWGKDRIYDMVGNLDEWVDAPDGAFLGGFYSRNTEAGCAAKVTVHPPAYYDYSLGTRCCR
jgi:formylglycine-generating enzyme required for sulfatase activity